MSALGDAFNALKQVVLMQDRLVQLDGRVTALVADVDGLTDALADTRDRVSRLEGFIEGVGAAARQGGGSPRLEG